MVYTIVSPTPADQPKLRTGAVKDRHPGIRSMSSLKLRMKEMDILPVLLSSMKYPYLIINNSQILSRILYPLRCTQTLITVLNKVLWITKTDKYICTCTCPDTIFCVKNRTQHIKNKTSGSNTEKPPYIPCSEWQSRVRGGLIHDYNRSRVLRPLSCFWVSSPLQDRSSGTSSPHPLEPRLTRD